MAHSVWVSCAWPYTQPGSALNHWSPLNFIPTRESGRILLDSSSPRLDSCLRVASGAFGLHSVDGPFNPLFRYRVALSVSCQRHTKNRIDLCDSRNSSRMILSFTSWRSRTAGQEVSHWTTRPGLTQPSHVKTTIASVLETD